MYCSIPWNNCSMNNSDLYISSHPQVKLWCDCPFWLDDGMCMLRDCSVCECPDNEFPESFKKKPYQSVASDPLICQRGNPQDTVDRTLDTKTFRGWIAVDNPWTNDDETDNSNFFSFHNVPYILFFLCTSPIKYLCWLLSIVEWMWNFYKSIT